MKQALVTPQMRRSIRDIAMKLGAIQMRGLGRAHQIRFKGEINLVTEVDVLCEKTAIKIIRRHFPDHQILGEESGSHKSKSLYCWVIDPLDGTTNYAHAYPLFCVSIALMHKQSILLGAVYEPNLGELFFAEKGKGATCNGKPIHVSKTKPLKKSLLSTGFAYNIGRVSKICLSHFKSFLKKSQAVRRDGVAAVDLAYVACGRFDGFWEIGLYPWDVAAGMLILKEAGGRVTLFNGKKVGVDDKEILASNGRIHKEMVGSLKKDTGIKTWYPVNQ